MIGTFALLVACAGDSPKASGASASTVGSSGAASSGSSPVTTAAEVLRQPSDLARLCSTHVGFSGAAAYAAGPGLHRLVFFESPGFHAEFVESANMNLPASWLIQDPSELRATQLVVCSLFIRADRPHQPPITCRTRENGTTVTVELDPDLFQVTVYEATTGKQVVQLLLERDPHDCPDTIQDSDRLADGRIRNVPDYATALRPIVAPS